MQAMQLVVEAFDFFTILTNGIIQLLALKVSAVRHFSEFRILINSIPADPLRIFFIALIFLQLHLYIAFYL